MKQLLMCKYFLFTASYNKQFPDFILHLSYEAGKVQYLSLLCGQLCEQA